MVTYLKSIFIIIILFSMILTGCSSKNESASKTNGSIEETDTNLENDSKEKPTTVDVTQITEFHQSPLLNDKDLPPVKERLPKDLKLTNEIPEEMLDYEIGTFGGTLRTVSSDPNWDADVFVMNNEPLLNTPGILGEEITGNILKGYEVTEDQKVFTFFMREGLKWSDGEPVTVSDVKFAVEDVLLNEDLMPQLPTWLKSGGKAQGSPFEFEAVDDFTFKLSFDEPYGGFPIGLAIQGWRGYTDLLKPAHYLKQFHQDYADAASLEKMIKEEDFKEGEWVNLFNLKDITNWELNHANAKGFPVLYPWIITEVNKTYTLYERNPYYFKIDAAGNQLPYIDQIKSSYVQDSEVVGLQTISGAVDFSRETTALMKMPLYRENQEKGGYNTLLADMHITPTDVMLNLTYNDPAWKKVVQDVRFRKALNYAIDREEIIESLYYGYAEPSTVTDSTFDIEKANELLDEMGMTKGSDGYRLDPNGNKFSIPFEVQPAAPDIIPLAELLTEMWKEVGIKVTVKTIDGTLWTQRKDANELKATIMWTTNSVLWYYGDWGQSMWAPLWDRWWKTAGKEGEEPPEDVKNFYSLIDEISAKPTEEAIQAIEEAEAEMQENVFYFIHIKNVKQPLIVNESLGNVTDKGTAIGVNFSGEQLFFK